MSLGVFRFLENIKIVLPGSFQGFQDTFIKILLKILLCFTPFYL